ncbi:MAG TPA: efflux transporter outer membrane subunit [Steroidobacteraceae bacterium]|jgi:NodT family efflux transporter outer membrane factor (OMF) lipoprotein|nr:efflux transporter outer membrane subunit [Steroidobacteraceae bacterium]
MSQVNGMPRVGRTPPHPALALRAPTSAILALWLGACSLAPTLQTPVVPTADSYKESGPWTQAQPADRLPRDSWWTLYGNAELDDLEKRLIQGSPTLAAAAANYAAARALSDQARAGLFPTLGVGAGVERDRESLHAPLRGPTTPTYYDSNTVGGSVGYELDLWGRIRNEVAAGEANAAAAAADLENARLSLIAQLVEDYVQLRSLDRDAEILNQSVTIYTRALGLTEQRHAAGIAPGLDVAQAQTQLDAARSQAAQTLAQRALMEHAIAALLGVSASTFSIAPKVVAIALPQVPIGVPATLLERRPDIAGAQRRMISANANIGVARAAYFPSLTLGAQGGFQSGSVANWLSAPSSFWAIGPNALLSVFDGGLRRAQVAQARAEFDASAAGYRSTVVGAFQQVEDSLATLHHYRDASVDEKSAVDAAQRSVDYAMALYKQGATGYLTVVTSQTALLQTRLEALNLDTLQLTASVDLIRALGGGWEEPKAYADDHSLAAPVADFEQHCEGGGPALRGTVDLQTTTAP